MSSSKKQLYFCPLKEQCPEVKKKSQPESTNDNYFEVEDPTNPKCKCGQTACPANSSWLNKSFAGLPNKHWCWIAPAAVTALGFLIIQGPKMKEAQQKKRQEAALVKAEKQRLEDERLAQEASKPKLKPEPISPSKPASVKTDGTGTLNAGAEETTKVTQTQVAVTTQIETTVTKTRRPRVPKSVAIFVVNRIGAVGEATKAAFEDLITSQVTSQGYTLISKEDILGDKTVAEKAGFNFDDQTVLSWARDSGAEYALVVSMTQLSQLTKKFDDNRNDIHVNNIVGSLNATYKFLGIDKGSSLKTGLLSSNKTARAGSDSGNLPEIKQANLDAMLTDLSIQIGDDVNERNVDSTGGGSVQAPGSTQIETSGGNGRSSGLPPPADASGLVDVILNCTVDSMAIPEVYKKDGSWVVGGNSTVASLSGVSVEVDGIVAGTTPGALKVRPGLHKLRLSREGYADITKVVNFIQGQELSFSMQMTALKRARIMDELNWMQSLKNGQILTEGEASRMNGQGEFYRNSKVSVDTKESHQSSINKNIEVKKVDD